VDVEAKDRAHAIPWLEAASIGEGRTRLPEHVTVHTGTASIQGHHRAVDLVDERRLNIDMTTMRGEIMTGFR
jgi:hypothetical protein